MILDAARLSLINLFAPETRSAFWKTLGLTFLILIGLWFGLRELFALYLWPWFAAFFPDVPDWTGWLTLFAAIAAGIGLALVLALLIAPITALIAGLFLDDVAAVIEKRDYPGDVPGREMPLGQAILGSIQFLGIVIIGNVIVVAELFLLTKSFWVLAIGIAAHCAGWLACLREPRLIDIWLVRIRRTPRNRNFAIWRCNSYRP